MSTLERDNKILEWQKATKLLEEARELESRLRKEVLTEVFAFNENVLREGTENEHLGNGYKLKAVFKVSRNLNNKDNAVDKVLAKIEKTGSEGVFIAERLVRWKPELSLTEYKNLPDKLRALVDEIVISKEAMPSLELVAPKLKQ